MINVSSLVLRDDSSLYMMSGFAVQEISPLRGIGQSRL